MTPENDNSPENQDEKYQGKFPTFSSFFKSIKEGYEQVVKDLDTVLSEKPSNERRDKKKSTEKKKNDDNFEKMLFTFFTGGKYTKFDNEKNQLKSISQRLNALVKVVNAIAKDVRSLQHILRGTLSKGKFAASKTNFRDLKPETVTSDTGQEYLYYKGAPPNRQFYEKSEKGTAGKIASKKVQRKLRATINQPTAIKSDTIQLSPDTHITPDILKSIQSEQLASITSMLAEKFSEQESNIANQLKKIMNKGSDEVDNNEEKALLEEALLGALQTIIRDNPELLKCQCSGSLPSLGRFGRARRGVGGRYGKPPTNKPTPTSTPEPKKLPSPTSTPEPKKLPSPTSTPEPKKLPSPTAEPTPTKPTEIPKQQPTPTGGTPPAIPETPGKIPDVKPTAKGGASKLSKISKAGKYMKGAGKFLLKKLPGIGLLMSAGLAASRFSKGDYSGAGLELASGALSTIPGLGTAASVGIDAGLAAKDAGVFDSNNAKPNSAQLTNAQTQTNLTPSSTMTEPVVTKNSMGGQPSGEQIIEMNREIQTTSGVATEKIVVKPVVKNIVNNNVLPTIVRDDKIKVYNDDSTFARIQYQDVDFPTSYGNLNMG